MALRKKSNKNTYTSYVFAVFIFLFLFFQPPSLDSSFFKLNALGVNVVKAECVPEAPTAPTGGLVPCGRIIDDQSTPLINENEPCTLCALFYMLKNVINFVMTLAIGIGVFILVIAGLLYAFSAGNPGKIELAKSAVTSALIGMAIVFIAWMAVAVILQGMGYANISTWNQVACNVKPGGPPTVLPYCGDGIVNNEEVCDWSVSPDQSCTTTFSEGLPAHCSGISVLGTQACNCSCDGWVACVASAPLPVESSSTACSSTSPQMNDYGCCELVSCTQDGCDCCGRDAGAAIPGGYTNVQSLSPCGLSNNSCRLSQSNSNPKNWTITTNHTTAAFRCWE
ncbi:pilin [Patescibacteria group bacterium]|nr:pilin [Patescibacteria group bacterium]MBU3999917.1 pilin [Patescibacteria group bacterium]MBU4057005.1 pilin [Patescibacteria group bacterium]MBU4368089.1 pilin [Patescibacteria group bacterium]